MLSYVVILFICSIAVAGGDILQKYEILDTNGYQSSFLYKGGKLIISCEATGADTSVQVKNRTGIVNKKLGREAKYNELPLDLEEYHVGQRYECDPSAVAGWFQIPELHCNPFEMTPAAICEAGQKCMIEKTGKPKCKVLDENSCFLSNFYNFKDEFKDSLPKLRVACVDFEVITANSNSTYGVCHEQAVNKRPVLGQAEIFEQCSINEFVHFSLNNQTIAQDTLFFETNADPKSWKLTHKSTLKGECAIESHDQKIIASFLTQDMNAVSPSTTLSIQGDKKPTKLQVNCNSTNGILLQNGINTYMVLYDPNPSLYTVTIQNKANSKDGSIVLTCVCKVPDGFHCQLNWSKPDEKVTSLETIPSLAPKTIESKERNTVRIETCYLQVWMYNHPAHTGLIKVPLNYEFKTSISIPKQEENPTDDKNNSSFDKESWCEKVLKECR